MIISPSGIYQTAAVVAPQWHPGVQCVMQFLSVQSVSEKPSVVRCFTAIQKIVICAELCQWEVREHPKLHL